MKQRIFCVLFSLTLSINLLLGQSFDTLNYYPITGVLINKESGMTISYIGIDISYKSYPLKTITILTDSKGKFFYKLPSDFDTIVLRISSKFYEPLSVNISKESFLRIKDGNMGKLELKTSINTLNEITVISKSKTDDINKSSYQAKLKNKSLPPVAASFLRTIPGIRIENNEYILNGFKTPIYYLNNVISSKDIIEKLNLDIIDKIEIIHNPPITAGVKSNQYIINVLTKRNLKYAIGGQASGEFDVIRNNRSYSTSYYYSTNNLLINVSSQMYTNTYNYERKSKWASVKDSLLNYTTQENGRYKIKPFFNSLSIQITPQKKLSAYSNISYNKRSISFNQGSLFFDSTSLNQSSFNNNTFKTEEVFNSNFNLKYLLNSKFTLFFLAGITQKSNSDSISNSTDTQNPFNSLLNLRQQSKDYSFSFTGNLKLEKGNIDFSVIYQNYTSRFPFFQSLKVNNNSININGQSNFYQRLIAPSISVTRQFNFGTLMFGSRLEQSSYYGEEIFLNLVTKKNNSLNLLPKVSFLKFTEKYGIFIFSYQNDIQLPNPYHFSLAGISYRPNQQTTGSLNLKPERNSSLTINHLLDKQNISINSSLYYNKSENYIGKGPYIQDSSNMFEQYLNLGTKQSLGLDVSVTYKTTKGFSLTTSFNIESLNFKLYNNILNNQYFFGSQIGKNNWRYKTSANITCPISETFSVILLSEIRNVNYDFFSRVNYSNPDLSLELNKSFFKQKLSTRLFWTQIFNLNKNEVSKYYSQDVRGSYTETTKFQSLGLTILYSFGKSKKTEKSDLLDKTIENRSIKSIN